MLFRITCYSAQITFMKPDTRELCGPIIIGYHWTADFIPWELFSFDRRGFLKGPGFFNKHSCCLLCDCSDRSAHNSYFQNLPTTYRPPTVYLPPPTDHLPTTYWPPTDHLTTDHLPTTYRPHTDHIPTTYRPHTDHLPTTFLRCSLFTITAIMYGNNRCYISSNVSTF